MLCETPHPGRAGARRRNAPAPLPRFPGRLPEGRPAPRHSRMRPEWSGLHITAEASGRRSIFSAA